MMYTMIMYTLVWGWRPHWKREERRERERTLETVYVMDIYICIEQLLDDVELVRSGI